MITRMEQNKTSQKTCHSVNFLLIQKKKEIVPSFGELNFNIQRCTDPLVNNEQLILLMIKLISALLLKLTTVEVIKKLFYDYWIAYKILSLFIFQYCLILNVISERWCFRWNHWAHNENVFGGRAASDGYVIYSQSMLIPRARFAFMLIWCYSRETKRYRHRHIIHSQTVFHFWSVCSLFNCYLFVTKISEGNRFSALFITQTGT